MSSKITLRNRYTVTAAVFAVIAIAVAGTLSAIGVEVATTRPVRQPRLARLTAITMISASISDRSEARSVIIALSEARVSLARISKVSVSMLGGTVKMGLGR